MCHSICSGQNRTYTRVIKQHNMVSGGVNRTHIERVYRLTELAVKVCKHLDTITGWKLISVWRRFFYFHRHYHYSTCYYPCIFENIRDKVVLPFSRCIHGANRLVWVNSEYVGKYIASFKRVETYRWQSKMRSWRPKITLTR